MMTGNALYRIGRTTNKVVTAQACIGNNGRKQVQTANVHAVHLSAVKLIALKSQRNPKGMNCSINVLN